MNERATRNRRQGRHQHHRRRGETRYDMSYEDTRRESREGTVISRRLCFFFYCASFSDGTSSISSRGDGHGIYLHETESLVSIIFTLFFRDAHHSCRPCHLSRPSSSSSLHSSPSASPSAPPQPTPSPYQ